MEVFYVLLGRPYKYDFNVSYENKNYTYTFEKDGIKHTLVPLKDEQAQEQDNPKLLLVCGK